MIICDTTVYWGYNSAKWSVLIYYNSWTKEKYNTGSTKPHITTAPHIINYINTELFQLKKT